MKINKIELKNFRSFEHLEIVFDKQMNIIVGGNGYGKSTILDIISILLSQYTTKLTFKKTRNLEDSDIKLGSKTTENSINATINKENLTWSVARKETFNKNKQLSKNIKELTGVTNQLLETLDIDKNTNIPLVAYYAVNRAVINVPLNIKNKQEFNQLSAYNKSLTIGTDFKTFFEWFREEEDWENEQKNSNNNNFKEPKLNAVRNAIKRLTGFENIKINRKPTLQMLVQKDGIDLDINQLSDGEKCLFAMTGDLARRLALANPSLSDSLLGEGVILIDEIDLHLHPEWQRMIISKLTKVFPNCQFIISTHSPQVLGGVKPNNIIKLNNNGGYEVPNDSYGWNTDIILEDIMGALPRVQEAQNDLNNMFQLLNEEKLNDGISSYNKILNTYGKLPELSRADVLISYLKRK